MSKTMTRNGAVENGKPVQRLGKAEQAQAAFARLLGESSRRGYYGSVSLTLNVQDGFIQQVRIATEEVMR